MKIFLYLHNKTGKKFIGLVRGLLEIWQFRKILRVRLHLMGVAYAYLGFWVCQYLGFKIRCVAPFLLPRRGLINYINMDPEIQEQRLFKYSIDFIRRHPDLRTDEIPTELLKYWLVQGFCINQWVIPTENQISIFAFAAHEQGFFNDINIIDTVRFFSMFMDYQVILATTYLSRIKGKPLKPVYIFDFHHYGGYDFYDNRVLMKRYNNIVTEPMIAED